MRLRTACANTSCVTCRATPNALRQVSTARESATSASPSSSTNSARWLITSNDGLDLHADYAPYQARRLKVADANAQLAWNFYAEIPDEPGGETTIHNSPWTWQPSYPDEVAENYPLDPALVAGAEIFTFAPRQGEVVMFNSRNPHCVSPVQSPKGKDRIAMATFIARMPDGNLTLWS